MLCYNGFYKNKMLIYSIEMKSNINQQISGITPPSLPRTSFIQLFIVQQKKNFSAEQFQFKLEHAMKAQAKQATRPSKEFQCKYSVKCKLKWLLLPI